MAVNLQAAKQLIQQRGVQPPPEAPLGTPAYDQWAIDWLTSAVDAGDPEAVQAAGGTAAEETSGGIAPWQDAAPSSEWLGKRKPTPRELRRYARDAGQSEDYQRFDDRQLAAWINKGWDAGQGAFFNDFGDRVEKPTESGPRSKAAGFATGEKSAGGGGGGAGAGAGKGKGKDKEGPLGEWAQGVNPELQQNLLSIFQQGGGYFDPNQRAGVSLRGGGMVWRDPEQAPAPAAQEAKAVGFGGGSKRTAPGEALSPFNPGEADTALPTAKPGIGTGPSVPAGPVTNAMGIGNGMMTSPALVSATLNAFSPQAPSKQAAGMPTGQPKSFAPTTPKLPTPGMPSPVVPPVTSPTPATTGTSPLTGALSQQYAKQNQWWMRANKNYTV